MNQVRQTAKVRTAENNIAMRVNAIAWDCIEQHMGQNGWALLSGLLCDEECDALAGLYEKSNGFRSHIHMARHGFGIGEYKYYSYPLPGLIAELRASLYSHLVPIANHWNELMGIDMIYPKDHAEFIARCHKVGQIRPTPLLLKYKEGDYNCLHQDLYGEQVFPMQVVFLLSKPNKDFTGGEFILTEQRPRMQSKAEVVPLRKGDAAVFAVHYRPQPGSRGYYRVNLRHGVSRLRSGHRYATGIIFHDAL